jgi:hypothetical protein
MVITCEGAEFIKITHGNLTIALNPISKKSKLKSSSFGADICLISLNHQDMNGFENTSRGDKEPFVIKGPGEYEIDDLLIEGFPTKSTYGGENKINTIYYLKVDSMDVLYMGAIGDPELSLKAKEEIGNVDVLFVPIGGNGVLEPAEAYKLALQREPKIIIPIHFGEQLSDKNALKDFLKEAGTENIKPVDKLTLKSKDLMGKEGEVVILSCGNN